MTQFDPNDRPWTHESVKTSRFDAVLAGLPIDDRTTVQLTFHPEEHGARWVGASVGGADELALLDAAAVGAFMEEVAHRGTAAARSAPSGAGGD